MGTRVKTLIQTRQLTTISQRRSTMTKRSMTKQRKRKSNKGAFDSEEDYKRFAEKRNAATKKCRRKISEERKLLREEMELLRVEGGRLGDLYWRNKAEDLKKELNEMDDQLTEKISRIAFLEREMQEYRRNVNLGTDGTATLYYPTTTEDVAETSTAVIIDFSRL